MPQWRPAFFIRKAESPTTVTGSPIGWFRPRGWLAARTKLRLLLYGLQRRLSSLLRLPPSRPGCRGKLGPRCRTAASIFLFGRLGSLCPFTSICRPTRLGSSSIGSTTSSGHSSLAFGSARSASSDTNGFKLVFQVLNLLFDVDNPLQLSRR